MDARGPFPFLISVTVFIGARRKNWVVLDKALVLLAVVLCALTVVRLAGLQRFSRQEGVAQLAGFLNALYWPASWMALKDYPPRAFSRGLRFVPLLIYGVASLFTRSPQFRHAVRHLGGVLLPADKAKGSTRDQLGGRADAGGLGELVCGCVPARYAGL